MSCCRYFEVNQRYRILKDTLKRGVPGVARFLFGVLPIFGGYVVFGTIMFGAQVRIIIFKSNNYSCRWSDLNHCVRQPLPYSRS